MVDQWCVKTLVPDIGFTATHTPAIFEELKQLSEAGLVSLGDITFTRAYIANINSKLKASTIGDHLSMDKDYGLGSFFPKISKGQPLTFDEAIKLCRKLPDWVSTELKFKITKIDLPALRKSVDQYLDDFIAGELTTGSPCEYFTYGRQRDLFWESFQRKLPNYGSIQPQTPKDIWQREGSECNGRFWELVFAIQKEGGIVIDNFGYSHWANRPETFKVGAIAVQFANPVPFVRLRKADKEKGSGGGSKEALEPTYSETDKIGSLHLGKVKISLGTPEGRKALLVKALCSPNFGTTKALNSLFEEITLTKDQNNSLLYGATAETQKKKIIEQTKKAIQKLVANKTSFVFTITFPASNQIKGVIKPKPQPND